MAKEPDTATRMRAWLAASEQSARSAARKSGVTHAQIAYVALGERDITVGKLDLVCRRAFGCSLAQFFGPLPGGTQ